MTDARPSLGVFARIVGVCLLSSFAQPAEAQEARGWVGRANSQFSARTAEATAFDSWRGVLVTFGGSGVNAVLGDTWEWDSVAWNRVATTGPAPRFGAIMVFDSARGVCVLFGGTGGLPEQTRYRDTWEWDGRTWSLRATTGPDVFGSVMTYDSSRAVTVLYEQNYSHSNVWEWDGAKWILRKVDGGPRPLRGPSFSYDVVHGVCVFFGGWYAADQYDYVNSNETWTWDGDGWKLVGAVGPAGRAYAVMNCDPVRNVTTLFGGRVVGYCNETCHLNLLDDTWEWNGSFWSQIASTIRPPKRCNAGIAYDDCRLRTIMCGGLGTQTYDGNSFAETWSYNGEWARGGVAGPEPRAGHFPVYDVARNVLVLWGGRSSNTSYQSCQETWEWNGKRWRRAATQGPFPYLYNTIPLVYDSDRGVTVFYQPGAGIYEWNGSEWALNSSGIQPSDRNGFVTFYDRTRHATIIAGGVGNQNKSLNDMWSWNGTKWTLLPFVAPAFRSPTPQACFDPSRARAVVIDRASANGLPIDTWEWDGLKWTLVNAINPPIVRGSTLAYDSRRNRTVMLSGGLWSWDGVAWSYEAVKGYSPTFNGGMVYDPRRDKLIAFSEYTNYSAAIDGLWEYGSLAPEVIQSPQPRTVREGDRVVLFAEVAGGRPMHYQWRRNGEALDERNGPSMVMDPIPVEWTGVYDCVVTNAYGTVTTAAARVRVLSTAPPQPQ